MWRIFSPLGSKSPSTTVPDNKSDDDEAQGNDFLNDIESKGVLQDDVSIVWLFKLQKDLRKKYDKL